MRLFRATASPLFDATGNIEGIIASARDITEAKRMEQQLIQTERLAAMGQMIAGVAHELNNPLTAVLGVTELLRDSASEENTRRQLDLAHRQARRAAEIVQSLLSFSRPPQPRKLCVHLSDLIQRSLQLHEHSLRTNNIAVDFVPKPDLPAVLGDASQLTQVFLNLITNAEQAIREVRDHGTLRIRIATLGGQRARHVSGRRRRHPPRHSAQNFRSLLHHQAARPRHRPGTEHLPGHSAGAQRLIEGQPLADGGSVFTVSIPVATATESVLLSPVVPSQPQAAPVRSHRLTGYKILVVDDEDSIRELVRDGLGVRGVRVDDAPTAEEALKKMTDNTYDAVLCDLNLAGGGPSVISGREFCNRVTTGKAGKPGAPRPFFMFMTGELVDGGTMEDLSRVGVRTLQKPFRTSELVAILTEALSRAAKTPAGQHD